MRAGVLAGLIILISGCHLLPARQPSQPIQSSKISVSAPSTASVVRYDRYLLVNTLPLIDQRDPLDQIIDVRIPTTRRTSLAEAMRYLLRDSGYTLCFPTEERQLLFSQPLPRVQAHIGPMRLREALQMLAGSEWQLEIDRLYRLVCFQLLPRSGERNA